MASFDRDTDNHRLDFQLMIRSPVRFVHDRALLTGVVDWLRRHDYRVATVDASWLITSHMFRDLGSALGYTCHDQWHCLSEALGELLAATRAETGFVLALTGFDTFARHRADDAQTLLDILAESAWSNAMLGGRMLCLVQSDDPDLPLRRTSPPPGGWLDHDRGPAILAAHRVDPDGDRSPA